VTTAILVPAASPIESACESSLRVLEQRGFTVWRVPGYSAIDQARNQLASDALAQGFDELIWIDSDIGFQPEDVERLRSHNLPIVAGIYPKKGKRALSCHLQPGTKDVKFGSHGGLLEIQYAATGFLYARREVYDDIRTCCDLVTCNQRFGRAVVPYFQPLVVPDGEGHWYLGEDFAFCERARRAGHRIWADTTVRLFHIGGYPYSWEDAGADTTRYVDYTFKVETPK